VKVSRGYTAHLVYLAPEISIPQSAVPVDHVLIYKALNGLGFTPPGIIASPVSHMVILLARFENPN